MNRLYVRLLFIFIIVLLIPACSIFHYFDDDIEQTDKIPPVVTILSPKNNDLLQTNDVKITGTAFDNKNELAGVYYYTDTSTQPTKISSDNNWTFDINLPNGTNKLYFYALDNSGNKNAVITLTLHINNPFNIQITYPVDNQFITTSSFYIKGIVNSPNELEGIYLLTDNTGDTKISDLSDFSHEIQLTEERLYTFGVYAIDIYNNRTSTVSVKVEVDYTKPIITIQTPASDNIVTGINVTFNGTINENRTIKSVLIGIDNALPDLTADSFNNLSWSNNINGLSDGIHILYVLAIDTAGNKSDIVKRIVNIDSSIPAVTLISPILSPAYYCGNDIVIKGNANGGKKSPLAVYVSKDGGSNYTKITLNTTLLSTDWSYNFDDLADGSYNLDIYCINSNNIESSHLTTVINVNTQSPTALTLSPASDSGISTNDGITNITTGLIFTGNYYFASSIQLYKDGTTPSSLGNTSSSATGIWSVTVNSTLSEGVHKLYYTATDNYGNVTSKSPLFNLTIDTSVSIPAIGFDTTVINGGIYNETKQVTITGSDIIEYSLDNGTAWNTYAAPFILSDGIYDLIARQSDTAGNENQTSAPISFAIDTIVPTAPIFNGIIESGIYKDVTVDLSGETDANIEYSVDGGAWTGYTAAIHLTLAEGNHSIKSRQTDKAGNISPESTINFIIDYAVPNPPLISDVENGKYYNTNITVSLSGELGATIEYSIDGGLLWVPYNSILKVPFITEGSFSIMAKQTDVHGRVSANSSSITFTIDKTKPSTPVINGVEEGKSYNSPTISITGEASTTIEYSYNGTAWITYPGTLSLNEGSNTLYARQTDLAGNISDTKTVTFIIDTIAPTATVNYSITTPTNGDVVATITPSETVTITNNGGSNIYTFTANGSFTFDFKDNAGNTGSVIASVSNIDKTAPTITISEPLAYDAVTKTGIFSKNDMISFIASATDAESGIVSYQWIDTTSSVVIVPLSTITAVNSKSITDAEKGYVLSNSGTLYGLHTTELTVTDAAGNVKTETLIIKIVDNQSGGINIQF